MKIVDTVPWPHCPDKNIFSDSWNRLNDLLVLDTPSLLLMVMLQHSSIYNMRSCLNTCRNV